MRAFFRVVINIALLIGIVRAVMKFTTIDEKIRAALTKGSTTSTTTATTCVTPRGVKIPSKSSVFAYKTPVPGSNGLCVEEQRQCVKGKLEGTFMYPSCDGPTTQGSGYVSGGVISDVGASCTTPWGQTIAHKDYIVAYESPASCRFQRRMCVDGQLLGSMQYGYCMINSTQNALLAQQATYDSISEIDAATAAGMSAEEFSNSIYGASPYAQGGSRQYSQVQYGGTVSNKQLPDDYWNQNDRGNVAVVNSRHDTKLNPRAQNLYTKGYQGAKKGSDDFQKYDLTQKGCYTPWGAFIENKQSVIAYKSTNPRTGVSCEYERRTCSNGRLGGTFQFDTCRGKKDAAREYGQYGVDNYYRDPKPTPTPSGKRSCTTPRGERVAHGDYVRAYKYSSAPRSNGCEGEIRYCRDGRLDGSYSNKSCTLTTPTYQGCYDWDCNNNHGCHGDSCHNNQYNNSCNLPRGGRTSHGSSVTAWTLINGVCYSEQRSCSNGYLNGTYTMQSCTPTSNNMSCTTPWGQTIAHGSSVEAYANPTAPCTKEIRRCSNGSLGGSFQYRTCDIGSTTTNPTTDTYGDRYTYGRENAAPHNEDTCQGDAVATFSCVPEDARTCTDIRKVENDCCIAGRARYEKRTVTCVR